jgi:putative transposase
MAIRTYQYRIYPTISQIEKFDRDVEFLRLLYNASLQERREHYKKFNKGISRFEQQKNLPEIKRMFPEETKNIHSQVIQEVLHRLDLAYSNFFRRIKNGETPGFPRFKKYKNYKSINFPQVKSDLSGGPIKLTRLCNQKAKLKVSGFEKEINVKFHREMLGNCVNVIIKKFPSGKFFVFFVCEDVPKNVYPTTENTVGIDLGLVNYLTLDDGKQFHHPKPYKTSKEKLAYRQRKLASKQRGSKNREKQRVLVAKQHEHVANIRDDFQHKLTIELLDNYDVIVMEKLDIKSMLENKGYEVSAANISEASWGSFVEKLSYKAESADNKRLILVNPRNTTKTCSSCLFVKDKMELSDRIYSCEKCGLSIDRDINAAKNIKRLGTSPVILDIAEAPPFRAG